METFEHGHRLILTSKLPSSHQDMPLILPTQRDSHVEHSRPDRDRLYSQRMLNNRPMAIVLLGIMAAYICFSIGSLAIGAAYLLSQHVPAVASLIQAAAGTYYCTTHTRSVDDNAAWTIFATGPRCDSDAQFGIISKGITSHTEHFDERACWAACILQDYGGTWAGFVVSAPAGKPVNPYYCGSAHTFGQCGGDGE